MQNINKIQNINFFRIFFTLMIVYGHIIQHYMMPMYGELPFFQNMSKHISYSFGYMCDMFFIISGFFLFFSFKKHLEFSDFVITKVIRLLPVLIFSIFAILLLSFIFTDVHYLKYQNFLAIFFLNSSFIANFNTNNNTAWYINVLFWGYIFYYCFVNLLPKEKINYAIGILIFFSYSVLLNKMELYNQPQIWQDGTITICMLRGIAGIGLGYLIGNWHNNNLQNYQKTKGNSPFSYLFFTVIEIVSLIYILI